LLKLGPQPLERGWKRQPLAQVLCVLVHGKAGTDRGQLEQDARRLPEIHRAEVEAIDHRGGMSTRGDDAFAPCLVVGRK
jgi:hypothetical protein